MIDDRLRAADPVADWRVDPESAPAQHMLTDILATPRATARPRDVRRRLAVAGAALAAAAVAATTFSIANEPEPAWALTTQRDGSVKLTVRWEELDDVDQLARALSRAGIATERTSAPPERYCATPAERDRASDALNEFHPGAEQPTSTEGYVMRPRQFPPGSVLVLAQYDDVAQKLHMLLMYLAPADELSCAVSGTLGRSEYYGPQPHPRRITVSVPPEGP